MNSLAVLILDAEHDLKILCSWPQVLTEKSTSWFTLVMQGTLEGSVVHHCKYSWRRENYSEGHVRLQPFELEAFKQKSVKSIHYVSPRDGE